MDVLSKDQRHRNMSNIKGKDTSIEVRLRKALWHKGYRYRKNYNHLPGKPDIVLTKYKVVIFCDSEFFHGKDWDILSKKLEQSNNGEFWIKKIARNKERDEEIDKRLSYLGWTVLRFWGRDILKNTDECVRVIEEILWQQKISDAGWIQWDE